MDKDRRSHRTAVALFAIAVIIAVVAAFITTFEATDYRHVSNEPQPGTIGLARPHAPLDRAPGEAARN
jgi:hypothetical protein